MTGGTRLAYLGEYPDPTEGTEGDLFLILDGPFANDHVYLGTGGRYGAARWAAEATLVPGEIAQLEDQALRRDLLPLMRAVAIQNGAPGFSRSAARSEPA